MILTFLSIVLFLIFTLLSGFHFYWFFGGVWGIENVIPTKEKNLTNLSIPKFATLIVAFGLAAFGLIYLSTPGFLVIHFPLGLLRMRHGSFHPFSRYAPLENSIMLVFSKK
ncbi:DUF3995 domain-containing protein [bacterium]|nr:DUF3995 domain-containing protein [bacterium]